MPTFPQHYSPRPYQQALHQAFATHRYTVAVLPRQSGKDVAASMEQCQARLRTPKTTGVYISLNNPMIRDILWDKTYLCPCCGEYIQGMQDKLTFHEQQLKQSDDDRKELVKEVQALRERLAKVEVTKESRPVSAKTTGAPKTPEDSDK